jgi:hypothetical protein
MKSLLVLIAAIVCFSMASDARATLAGGCDQIQGKSVSFFLGNAATLKATNSTPAKAPVTSEPLFLVNPGPGGAPLGCSSSDCTVCNNNGLKCSPVPGDCCCV